MMHRKDLLFAILAGAILSAIGCLLFAPRNAEQPIPEREAASKAEARQSTPPVSAVVTDGTRVAAAPALHNNDASAVAVTHPVKPGRTFKKPVLLPESLPTRKVVASNSPDAQTDATPAPSMPVTQNSATAVTARVVTAQEARVALGKVGTDPEAEAVWITAINDPNLPANQRKDLIEDLNEEGFANPKQLTAADLPRIENRLALIEELAPEAIDQTNADAFQEAYKDLKSMQSRLSKP